MPVAAVADAPSEGRVISKAVVRAADRLGIKGAGLARVLGVSDPTVSRLKSGGFELSPGSKEFEIAVLFVRLFRGLDAIVGGDAQAARSWMTTENTALRGTPAAMIETIEGLMQAVQYVDARRARV